MFRRRLVLALAVSAVMAGCGQAPIVPVAIPSNPAPAARAAAPVVAPPPRHDKAAVPGEVVVKFRPGEFAPGVAPALTGARALRAVDGLEGAWVYLLEGGRYTTAAADTLRGDPRLEFAEPNYLYHVVEDGAAGFDAAYTPPGEEMRELWGIRKIEAPAAWDDARGKGDVLVAVIDTGVDYRHSDLRNVVVKGPDLVNGDGDPMDDHGHGTHVAGTIAARNDGAGVVGVAFGVKILAVKALDEDGSGPEDQIARAIDAAIQNGARVINMSLGGPDDSWAMREAVRRASRKGVLCVVAAGNDGSTGPGYPAAYDEAFAVGASDPDDRRAYFSNYGEYVQIAAPGVGVLSSSPRDGYEWLSGTSMAAPHVAGAAALLLSAYPRLDEPALKRILSESGDSVGGFSRTPNVRRLNVRRALARAAEQAPPGSDPGDDPDAPTGISEIKIVKRTTDGAIIRWRTAEPTLGFLEYGRTKDYGATTFYEDSFGTEHEVTVSGLRRFKWYHFRVHAQAPDGRKLVSGDHSFLTKLWWLFSLEETAQ